MSMPKKGDVITYSFEGLRSQMPVAPTFISVRHDILWEDLVVEYERLNGTKHICGVPCLHML